MGLPGTNPSWRQERQSNAAPSALIGDSPVQPLTCEVCDEPTTAESWIEGLRLMICPLCLEMQIEAQSMEPKTL